jgi:hypothetical protein
MVLDEDDQIVEVGRTAEDNFMLLRGKALWEVYPGAEPFFKPYYDKARRTGEPVEFVQFYQGYFTSILAVPEGSSLFLYWEVLCHLDTLTLERVWTSLHEAMAIIEQCEDRVGRERMRGLLSLVDIEKS